MKICLITDLHFGIKSDSEFFINYQLNYINKQLIPYCVDNRIDTIVCLGDFFHSRKSINVRTLHLVKEKFLDVLKEKKIKLIVICGNHDLFYTSNNEITSLNIFKDYNNIKIINNNTIIEYDEVKFGIIPWLSNKEDEDKFRKFIEDNPIDYILGHFEFIGFQMVKGITCKNGLDYKDLNKFRGIFSGHFHNRQQGENNILYLGTPYELSWSSFSEFCGFHVFDTKNHDLFYIKNEDKIYHKIFYKEKEEYDDDFFNGLKHKILKIYPIEKDNDEIFQKFIKKIEYAKPHEYQIVEQGNIEKEDIVINDQESLLETIKLFLESSYNKDKEILFNIAKKLYLEVGIE